MLNIPIVNCEQNFASQNPRAKEEEEKNTHTSRSHASKTEVRTKTGTGANWCCSSVKLASLPKSYERAKQLRNTSQKFLVPLMHCARTSVLSCCAFRNWWWHSTPKFVVSLHKSRMKICHLWVRRMTQVGFCCANFCPTFVLQLDSSVRNCNLNSKQNLKKKEEKCTPTKQSSICLQGKWPVIPIARPDAIEKSCWYWSNKLLSDHNLQMLCCVCVNALCCEWLSVECTTANNMLGVFFSAASEPESISCKMAKLTNEWKLYAACCMFLRDENKPIMIHSSDSGSWSDHC